MLAVIQFPIADLRFFSPYYQYRLEASRLPRGSSSQEEPLYLRGFGAVSQRRRLADKAWPDEHSFWSGKRGLRLPDLPRVRLGGTAVYMRPVGAFRRVFCHGPHQAVARIEIGLAHAHRAPSLTWLNGDQCHALVRDLIQLKAEVKVRDPVHPYADIGSTCNGLLFQRRALAKHYCHVTVPQLTSRVSHPIPPMSDQIMQTLEKLVLAVTPMVILNFEWGEVAEFPRNAVQVDSRACFGAALAYEHVDMRQLGIKDHVGSCSVWYMAPGLAKDEDLRSLRLCLLRLHAEREVYHAVLDYLDAGFLQYEPHTEHGDALEEYVNVATQIIESRDWCGISTSGLLGAYKAFETVERPDAWAYLQKMSAGFRRQVQAKLQRSVETRQYRPEIIMQGGEVIMGSTFTFHGGTYYGPIGDFLNSTWNIFEQSPGAKNEALNQQVSRLLSEVDILTRLMDEHDTTEVKGTAKGFVDEVGKSHPDENAVKEKGKALVEFAKAFAEVAKPIADTVGAVFKILGIVGIAL